MPNKTEFTLDNATHTLFFNYLFLFKMFQTIKNPANENDTCCVPANRTRSRTKYAIRKLGVYNAVDDQLTHFSFD